MQRRTLGTREALEGILEDAATPTRAFASDYGYDLVSLLLPGDECSYVMGNPPFIGHQQHTQQIKDDMELVCGKAGGSMWFRMPSRPAISCAEKARNGLQDGSGARNSMRFAAGEVPASGIRMAAERLRAEYTKLTGASKPGTRRW